jgi:hypothetical protein
VNDRNNSYIQLTFPLPFRPYTPDEIEQRRAAGRKRAASFTRQHQSQAGRKLVEQRGTDYMSEIGSAGYFECGARHGWEFVNTKVFGKHLTKRQAKKQRIEKLRAEQTAR